ncbi:YybH family protein [Adhaeribacter radiodurans]|uniref:SgcJ/EcaC family oxidoreductase n=1 Tax=Adhaeribacter radiodurans TaxID=2745197 RepID=A0A7L7LD33_9BACT|nr:SgcJ/EcaC family oxidoreductase [Adhaeribacter radiodurans]QMU30604.1 SgcJ/EcaC family oxidoreductase [Adhaeribacter radiodurans]
MKTFIFLLLTVFVSIVSMGQSSKDEESVKKVINAFQDDFNDGSFKNAAAYTTSDWEHLDPGGGIVKGREEVLKVVRGVHQTILKGVSMTIQSMSIRFITPDVAIADVIHKISDFELPAGVKHKNELNLKTYVVVKQKGKWLLTHDQNTTVAGSNTAENPK